MMVGGVQECMMVGHSGLGTHCGNNYDPHILFLSGFDCHSNVTDTGNESCKLYCDTAYNLFELIVHRGRN